MIQQAAVSLLSQVEIVPNQKLKAQQ